jgi:hypothetical protein
MNREIERERVKAFYHLLVDRLGIEAWALRKDEYLKHIRLKESQFNIKKPVEPQLFYPEENDIDWYIIASYLAYDFPYSDCAYSSTRIYPYAMAIGSVADELRKVPNINNVLDRMLANNNKPETQLFELLTASFYLKNGYEVSFIPENSIAWPDGKTKKSPDLLVKSGELELYVECKRAKKQTRYSEAEEKAWSEIWGRLSQHMHKVAPWCIVDLVFHEQLIHVTSEEVINAVNKTINCKVDKLREGLVSVEIRTIDKVRLESHYQDFAVRPSSPQHELLVFGNMDSNEKRSISTIANQVTMPGNNEDILNMFVEQVDNVVGAQWSCEHEASLDKRSKHFKSLLNSAIIQFPPDRKGIVHIWYETCEGIKIEELRNDKNIINITNYDASGTTMLGVFLHAVNYYPFEDSYDWAETVKDFARIPNLNMLFPKQSLMLASNSTHEVENITHWEQDKTSKQHVY